MAVHKVNSKIMSLPEYEITFEEDISQLNKRKKEVLKNKWFVWYKFTNMKGYKKEGEIIA